MPGAMGSFPTTEHFLIFLCTVSVFYNPRNGNYKHLRIITTGIHLNAGKNSIPIANDYLSWRIQSPRMHTLYLQSRWMGGSPFPSISYEVYYLQGCHAGTFSKYKSEYKTMLKNTALHCIVSTLWWNDITTCYQFVDSNWENVQKSAFYCKFNWSAVFSPTCPWKSSPLVEAIFQQIKSYSIKNQLAAFCWCEL